MLGRKAGGSLAWPFFGHEVEMDSNRLVGERGTRNKALTLHTTIGFPTYTLDI